ncbi:phosphoribosylglycinamide formyltransferase [Actinomyces radicidentis]|uniref:phosphoribosylglycinamide formyltransferase n=1 Tax=Actinomyces radicidentis TaxID=111015 RepID=UPI0028EB5E5B|nr:phosphoribosylglycinamide formyltransferase [Actinomyces radicidentis]
MTEAATEAGPTMTGAGAARLVVLVSGTGSNLVALLRACEDPAYGAEVVRVVADKPCPGVGHALAAGVEASVVAPRDFADRPAWDEALAEEIAGAEPDLVVCAGFMRILGEPVLTRLEGRIINTHPSLLPSFPGAHAVRDALAAGATRAGATLFWVDAGVDTGEHITQVEVPVLPGDTEESLTARVKAAETPQLVEQVGILARERRH